MENKAIIQKIGLKVTRANLLVLETLKKSHSPLSAKNIWQKNKETINLVSIYRILEKFKKAQLVYEDSIDDDRPEKIYHLSPSHHHHLICQKCHKIFCTPCQVKIKTPKNFTIIRHQIQIIGLCDKCHV